MARKKKESRKYTPLDEFRYNNSPLADGHLHYVFGKKRKKYKSLGLTHSEDNTAKKIKIDNPNPNDKKDKKFSYLQLRVHTANEKYYSDKVEGLQFTKEARGVVRHRIKQYKKATNRKPPMWYENKKKNKKK